MTTSAFEHLLSDACMAVAASVLSHDALAGTSHVLVERASQLTGFSSVVLSAVMSDGGLRLLYATDDRARQLDSSQLACEAGPAVECAARGHGWSLGQVSEAARRWPAFRANADAQAVGSMIVAALCADGETVGVVSLYSSSPDVPADRAKRSVATLAAIAAVGLAIERERAVTRREADGAAQALYARAQADQAAGVLAGICAISVGAAHTAMRAWAVERGLSEATVSRGILTRDVPRLLPVMVAAPPATVGVR